MNTTVEVLPPTISVEHAGELLGVSRRSAYRAASRGQIPTVRVGRRLLVPTQRLLDMLGMAHHPGPERQVAPQLGVPRVDSVRLVVDDDETDQPIAEGPQ